MLYVQEKTEKAPKTQLDTMFVWNVAKMSVNNWEQKTFWLSGEYIRHLPYCKVYM